MASQVGQVCTVIPQNNFFKSQTIDVVNLKHDGCDFFILDSSGTKTLVHRAHLPPELHGTSTQTLQKMLELGYFSVRKRGNEYTISR